jgi:hypothetical protein
MLDLVTAGACSSKRMLKLLIDLHVWSMACNLCTTGSSGAEGSKARYWPDSDLDDSGDLSDWTGRPFNKALDICANIATGWNVDFGANKLSWEQQAGK